MSVGEVTRNFLVVVNGLAGQSPYRSDEGVPSWPLAFYGVGSRLGSYRITLFLEETGAYSHLLLQSDGEMEIQRCGISLESTNLQVAPSLYADFVVGFEGGGFRKLRPASGPNGPEDLPAVLARSLDIIQAGSLPPVFDYGQSLD
jgi:hypothetical protein